MATLAAIRKAATAHHASVDDTTPDGTFVVTAKMQIDGSVQHYLPLGTDIADENAPILGRVTHRGETVRSDRLWGGHFLSRHPQPFEDAFQQILDAQQG